MDRSRIQIDLDFRQYITFLSILLSYYTFVCYLFFIFEYNYPLTYLQSLVGLCIFLALENCHKLKHIVVHNQAKNIEFRL